ncbi:MAG: hypothetical protein E3J72_10155 [Planctomycetota bacterium]|nr:MAG: hypothetical protein E3J72_10155 [Planctomycetota bacterium]
MKKRLLVLCLCLLFLTFAASAGADVIHLKDGKKIEGEIISENEKEVVIETSYGERTISRDDIRKIEYDRPREAETAILTHKQFTELKGIVNDYINDAGSPQTPEEKEELLNEWRIYRGRKVYLDGTVWGIKKDKAGGEATVEIIYLFGSKYVCKIPLSKLGEIKEDESILLTARIPDYKEPRRSWEKDFDKSVRLASDISDTSDTPKPSKPSKPRRDSAGGDTPAEEHAERYKEISKEHADSLGGNAGIKRAIECGLDWLARHQSFPAGQWDGDGYNSNCRTDKPCPQINPEAPPAATFDIGITGLALSAFLANGLTPSTGRYKDNVKKAIAYLLSSQNKKTGVLGSTAGESWIYNHALGTIALCEACIVTEDRKVKRAARKAVDYIIKSQNPGAGWKYEPKDGKSDTSITSWMVQALSKAQRAGLEVPPEAFNDALAWIGTVTRVKDGKVGYVRAGDSGAKLGGRPPDTYASLPTMTAAGLLCRVISGQKKPAHDIVTGLKLLRNNLPDYNRPKLDKVNFYYWYYGTNALARMGGAEWEKWNSSVRKALLTSQRAVGICQAGSWDPVGEWCVVGGRTYATAINVLTLEAFYRHELYDTGKQPAEAKACNKCGGGRRMICKSCKGAGTKGDECSTCKGNGLIKCSKCKGRGRLSRNVDCPRCNKICSLCGIHHSGEMHCTRCKKDSRGRSTGKKACMSCKGRGYKNCSKCKGKK